MLPTEEEHCHSMPENRQRKRHRKRLQLRYGVNGSMRMAFTEDVSDEGFFIRTTTIHSPNSDIRVELMTPANECILLEGRVRWAKRVPPNLLRLAKGGMGIRITRFLAGEAAYRKLCEEMKSR
jgi:hypothetical protein